MLARDQSLYYSRGPRLCVGEVSIGFDLCLVAETPGVGPHGGYGGLLVNYGQGVINCKFFF